MRMNIIVRLSRCASATLLAVVVTATSAAAQSGATGDAAAGRAAFSGGVAYCSLCHGGAGGGGFGPDLAGGRGLTFEQFKHAIVEPWGVMPAFPNIDDQTLMNMYAWLSTLTPVDQPAPQRTPLPPAGSPLGQQLAISYGCSQCHGAELADPRRDLGGLGMADWALLKRIVFGGERPTYEPAQGKRPNRMGIFNPERLPEPVLEEIFRWMTDETGLRVPMAAEIHAEAPANGNTTYTLLVENEGTTGKGLAAEDITINLVLPSGTRVINTSGDGYQGVERDAELMADVAVWKVRRIAPGDKPEFTITLSGTTLPDGLFQRSSIRWTTPALQRPAGQVARDARIPEEGDWISTTGAFQAPNGVVRPLIITPAAN